VPHEKELTHASGPLPDDPQAPARIVEDAAPLRGDPADNPVLLADDAVLDIVSRAVLRVRRRFVAGQHAVAVVRVEAGIEIRPGDRGVGRDAKGGLDPRLPEQIAGHEIEVPQPDLARLGRQPELFLAPPQLGFRLAAGFVEPGLFERDGGLFRDTGGNQTMVELSNVDLGEEAAQQIAAQRSFEANLQTLRTGDALLGSILDIKK